MPTAFAKTQLIWNPRALDAALLDSFRRSLPLAQADAVAHSPAKGKAGARLRSVNAASIATARATLAPTGLGAIFEQGRKGGYPITPKGAKALRRTRGQRFASADQFGRTYNVRAVRGATTKAIRFTHGDGGFAAYAVGGAMAAEPYIKPAGVRWAQGGFQSVARVRLAAGGFGVAR